MRPKRTPRRASRHGGRFYLRHRGGIFPGGRAHQASGALHAGNLLQSRRSRDRWPHFARIPPGADRSDHLRSEEEYFLVDARTKRAVRSMPETFFKAAEVATDGRISREFLQAQIEVITSDLRRNISWWTRAPSERCAPCRKPSSKPPKSRPMAAFRANSSRRRSK